VRPNADDVDVAEILAELEAQNAKSLEKTLVAAAKTDGLQPDEKTIKQAEVAAFNGYVAGTGHEGDDGLVHLSTKEHPRVFQRLLTEFGSSIGASLLVAREAAFGRQRDPDV
jgi:hypothetical protein